VCKPITHKTISPKWEEEGKSHRSLCGGHRCIKTFSKKTVARVTFFRRAVPFAGFQSGRQIKPNFHIDGALLAIARIINGQFREDGCLLPDGKSPTEAVPQRGDGQKKKMTITKNGHLFSRDVSRSPRRLNRFDPDWGSARGAGPDGLKISHQFPGGTIDEGRRFSFRDPPCCRQESWRAEALEKAYQTGRDPAAPSHSNSSAEKTVDASVSAVRKNGASWGSFSLYPIFLPPAAENRSAELNIGLICLGWSAPTHRGGPGPWKRKAGGWGRQEVSQFLNRPKA